VNDQLRPPEHVASDEPRPSNGLKHLFWIFYLYFRPREFYETFVRDHAAFLTVLAAWLVGMSQAEDRLQRTAQRGQINVLLESWPVYFGGLAAGGAFSALLFFWLGGWWYRMRLSFCGVKDAPYEMARRVYLHACTVWALPGLLFIVWQSTVFPRPVDAINAPSSWWQLGLVTVPLFWSVWTSVTGVRTIFEARGWKMWLWFAVLPTTVYALALGFIVFAALSGHFVKNAPPPAVSQMLPVNAQGLEFRHPSNWTVRLPEPEALDQTIEVEPPQDAFMYMAVYEAGDPGEDLQSTVDHYVGLGFREVDRTVRYGGRGALCARLQKDIGGSTVYLDVVRLDVGDGAAVDVVITSRPDDDEILRPGFDAVIRSIRLAP
jgi:hypothetical protein